jgi:hypothetical protein
MPESVSSCSSSLREAVLAGPGAERAVVAGWNPLMVVATRARVRDALVAAGHVDKCRGLLTGAVTTVLVIGLCLYCGQGSPTVIARLWSMLTWFNPAILLSPPVTASALSQARARLSPMVVQKVFEAGAAAGAAVTAAGCLMFGLVVTAVDGTVFDLAGTDLIRERFATPSGGRFPQARVVTLVVCGTRRVLAAVADSCAVSEQRLWDRLVTHLRPGTLALADRNLCATWRFIAFPVQPGGIGGTFLDPMAHPDPKGNGDRSMPEKTGDRVQADGAMRRGVRMIWLKLDCLNPNLQWRQGLTRRKVVCNRRRPPCIRIEIARCSLREADNVQRGRVRR